MIIIPLGGIGKRFKDNGYTQPKPLVNVFGKPIIYWLIERLPTSMRIIIPYNNILQKYDFEDKLRKDFPQHRLTFYPLPRNTEGAAETLLLTLDHLNLSTDGPVLSLDGDNFYNCDIVKLWSGCNSVFVIKDTSGTNAFSFVEFKDGYLKNIAEKERISDYACTGAYGFNSWRQLQSVCRDIVNGDERQKGEYYISNVYSHTQSKFKVNVINTDDYVCLGNPLQVRVFCNNYPRKNTNGEVCIQPRRYCFDLDGTLVTFPQVQGDYTTVKPIHKNIKMAKYLKNFGHTIIIYTARRMKTHQGNTGALLADIGKVTFDTLEKFSIPYDEIYFGKPYADYYIDDLGINAHSDLEKGLGYYDSSINPREFNTLQHNVVQTYRKTSSNLEGQIKYYLSIPPRIKDMFPLLIDYDVDWKWYEMEKINGIPASKLYVNELLTVEQLDTIMNSLQRIHQITGTVNDVRAGYVKKLIQRKSEYDYSDLDPDNDVYNKLVDRLGEYEKADIKTTMIHGDPVLTNVIINNFGKIKFIDMRGTLGNECTTMGDSMYDWAKLYQSLIGYDEIHEDYTVSYEYRKIMVDRFLNRVKDDYLNTVTASLLYTLIPLHDNDKCERYMELCKSLLSFNS